MMRKLLEILAATGLVATTSATVVACGTKDTGNQNGGSESETPTETNLELINSLKEEIQKIVDKHIVSTANSLIGLPTTETDNAFIKLENLVSKGEINGSALDSEEKVNVKADLQKILKTDELKTEVNKLKEVLKFRSLFTDLPAGRTDVLANFIIDFDNFKLKSSVLQGDDGSGINGTKIASLSAKYSFSFRYMNNSEVDETYALASQIKYTSTDNETIATSIQKAVTSIQTDLLNSTDFQSFQNLKWNDIKGAKDIARGYGDITSDIKNYYNTDTTFSNKIIDFVKTNYLASFATANNFSVEYNADKSVVSSTAATPVAYSTSLTTDAIDKPYLASNKDATVFDYADANGIGQKMVNAIFRQDPNGDQKEASFEAIKTNYFTDKNINLWAQLLNTKKGEYLDAFTGLTSENKTAIKESQGYKTAIALGKVQLNLPNIIFNKGQDSEFVFETPSFEMASTYSINGNLLSEEKDNLTNFALSSVSAWQSTFGVDHSYQYPTFNSSDDILFAIKGAEILETLKFEDDTQNLGSFGPIKNAMSLINRWTKRNELFNSAGIKTNERYLFSFDGSGSDDSSTKSWGTYYWAQNQNPVYKTADGIYLEKAEGTHKNHHNLNFRFGLFNFIIKLSDIYKLESSESKLLIKFTS